MKVYIVIEMKDPYKLIGVFKNKKDAEDVAYRGGHGWCNVVEKELL